MKHTTPTAKAGEASARTLPTSAGTASALYGHTLLLCAMLPHPAIHRASCRYCPKSLGEGCSVALRVAKEGAFGPFRHPYTPARFTLGVFLVPLFGQYLERLYEKPSNTSEPPRHEAYHG